MTKLKAANVFFFQWFFVRLTKCTEKRVENYNLISVDLMQDGYASTRGTGNVETYQWYSIQFWILPCTGWWDDYIYLNTKPKFFKCTKERLVR